MPPARSGTAPGRARCRGRAGPPASGLGAPVSSSRRAIQAAMRSSSRATTSGSACGQVRALLGVFDHVVEFDLRAEVEVRLQGVDELPLGRAPAVLAHPGTLGDVELGEPACGARRAWRAAGCGRRTRRSRFDAQQVQHRRRHVLQQAAVRHPQAGRHAARHPEHERHPQRVLVEAVVVEVAAVLVERLAVVGRQHEQRVAVQARARPPASGRCRCRRPCRPPRRRTERSRNRSSVIARRHPAAEVVAEGLERQRRLHALVAPGRTRPRRRTSGRTAAEAGRESVRPCSAA